MKITSSTTRVRLGQSMLDNKFFQRIVKTCKNRLGHHERPKHECFQREKWKKTSQAIWQIKKSRAPSLEAKELCFFF